MFLPILIFIPNVFYYAFNEHATNSESTTINYRYESNEVNSTIDIIDGHIYHFSSSNVDYSNIDYTFIRFYIVNGSISGSLNDIDYDYDYVFEYSVNQILSISFDSGDVYIQQFNSNGLVAYQVNVDVDSLVIDCDILYLEDFDSQIGEYRLFSYTNFNVIDDVEINTNDTISDKVYKGWQSVWSLPIFSWSSNTFFSAPFNYVSGLFGFQEGNTLSNCLSYWFSISIIWLVFDLMLYVPLLVHRWLDKASIS